MEPLHQMLLLFKGTFSGSWCLCSAVFRTSGFSGRILWLMLCTAVFSSAEQVFGLSGSEFNIVRPRSNMSVNQCASLIAWYLWAQDHSSLRGIFFLSRSKEKTSHWGQLLCVSSCFPTNNPKSESNLFFFSALFLFVVSVPMPAAGHLRTLLSAQADGRGIDKGWCHWTNCGETGGRCRSLGLSDKAKSKSGRVCLWKFLLNFPCL